MVCAALPISADLIVTNVLKTAHTAAEYHEPLTLMSGPNLVRKGERKEKTDAPHKLGRYVLHLVERKREPKYAKLEL